VNLQMKGISNGGSNYRTETLNRCVCVDSLLTWRSPNASRQLLLALVVVFLLSCLMSGVAFFRLAGNHSLMFYAAGFFLFERSTR